MDDLLNVILKWLLINIAGLTLCTQINGAPVGCDHGFYYDKITGKCDPCEDICFEAVQQGTLAKCHLLCPDFTSTTTPTPARSCPKNFYYDLSVDRCDSCEVLCTGAFSRGLEAECKNNCPDWPLNDQPTKRSPEFTTAKSVVHKKVGNTYIKGAVPIWVPIVIGVLLTLCIVLICWFRRDIIYKIKNLCLCSLNRRPRRPQQVVSDRSTHRYDPIGLLPIQYPLETQV